MDTKVAVLVVDDEESVRKVVVRQIKTLGFSEVISVADGVEAWDTFFCSGVSGFGLVVSDKEMSVWSGIELLVAMRDTDANRLMPFVLISGNVDDVDHGKAEKANAVVFDKPFSIEQLQAAIEAAFAKVGR